MANPTFLTNVDFSHNQLLNLRYQLLPSAPSTPSEGWAYWDSALHQLGLYTGSGWVYVGTGSGTVTSVSVVTANGFAGTVATSTSTPAITITTTITGMLKGNGTAISAATSGTDFAPGTSALSTGILKSTTGTGVLSIAVSATDYAPATTGSSILKASSGGFANAVAGTDYAAATNGSNTNILTSNGAGGFGTALVVDTDVTLSANSDSRIATQKAIKAYADAIALGIQLKPAARAATTGALPANTYNNGTAGVGATLTATGNGALAAQDGVTLGQATNQNITACTNASTTVTVTITSNAGMAVGQAVTIAGITGFTTNNPNGNFRVNTLVSTNQFTFIVDNAPTGSYTSGGTSVTVADVLFVKNEATMANSGLYALTQQGSAGTPYILTRLTAMDSSAEMTGAQIIVESQGTTNKNTVWMQTVISPNVGTTPLAYTQINLSSDLSNGTGIATITNNTIAVDTTVVPLKFSADIGNGSLTAITVTHNLGTKDIIASVRDKSSDSMVYCDIVATSTTTATFTFTVAPTTNQFRVTIHG